MSLSENIVLKIYAIYEPILLLNMVSFEKPKFYALFKQFYLFSNLVFDVHKGCSNFITFNFLCFRLQ